jgi:hypothetical protein
MKANKKGEAKACCSKGGDKKACAKEKESLPDVCQNSNKKKRKL